MARLSSSVERVTVSIPRHLLEYADSRAEALGTTRSHVVSAALSELRARERDSLAREGYAFYARESEEFAASSLQAVSEAIVNAD